MKKLMVAAGISAMVIVSAASAFADSAKTDSAPRVVDRLAAAVVASDEVAVPVKPGTPTPVPATVTYNSLITQATGTEGGAVDKTDCFYNRPTCSSGTSSLLPVAAVAAGLVTVALIVSDKSESD